MMWYVRTRIPKHHTDIQTDTWTSRHAWHTGLEEVAEVVGDGLAQGPELPRALKGAAEAQGLLGRGVVDALELCCWFVDRWALRGHGRAS